MTIPPGVGVISGARLFLDSLWSSCLVLQPLYFMCNMKRKCTFLLFACMLGWLHAEIRPALVALSADGSETVYELASVGKITFDGQMVVEDKQGQVLQDGVSCVLFAEREIDTALPQIESQQTQLFVFPNPVVEQLTVTGTDAQMLLRLFDINGRLVNVFETSDGQTQINVSNLAKGNYLLQIGNQVVKFIKN